MINMAVGLRNPYFSETEKSWVWKHANTTLVQISPSSISLFFLILCIFPLNTYTWSFSGICSFHFIHLSIHSFISCWHVMVSKTSISTVLRERMAQYRTQYQGNKPTQFNGMGLRKCCVGSQG